MFIDTHCHLTHRYVPADEVSGVIHRARDAGVGALVMSGAAVGDAADAVALCEKYDNLFCTVGIHPEYAISPSLRGSGEQGEPRGSSPSRLRRQPPSKG
ncbi:MAG: TatD family hydrolase, partial [Alphaproteobacteria bacterium]|nr:TatD family hydrolase [Alphaproteobacteria bacterium]